MKRFKIKNPSFSALVLIGAAICLTMLIPVSLTLAIISSFMNDPTSATGILALISSIVSAALSGIIIARIAKEGRLPISALSSLIAVAVMIIIGLVWKGGIRSAGVFLNHAAYIGVTVLCAYFCKAKQKRRKYR